MVTDPRATDYNVLLVSYVCFSVSVSVCVSVKLSVSVSVGVGVSAFDVRVVVVSLLVSVNVWDRVTVRVTISVSVGVTMILNPVIQQWVRSTARYKVRMSHSIYKISDTTTFWIAIVVQADLYIVYP